MAALMNDTESPFVTGSYDTSGVDAHSRVIILGIVCAFIGLAMLFALGTCGLHALGIPWPAREDLQRYLPRRWHFWPRLRLNEIPMAQPRNEAFQRAWERT